MTMLSDDVLSTLRDAAPVGFHVAGDRRWVSDPTGAIRKIVEFEELKGGQYSARWGFSVDFVPIFRRRRLAWKRTLASADFDLCIDPIDPEGSVPKWCSFASHNSASHVRNVARQVWEASSKDFADVSSLADLLQLFERRSKMTFRRFSLANYVQTDLAWGLTQLAVGQVEAGSERIFRFCEERAVDPETPLLLSAKADAEGWRTS